jgi:tetratricopeptide (TPR) repeat protein
MQRSFLLFLINLFLLCLVLETTAQDVPEDFTRLSDSILSDENATYGIWDQLLTPYAKDEILLQKLIEKSKRTGNQTGLSYGYNELGKLNYSQFNYPKAVEYHKNALQIAKQDGDPLLQMTTLNLLGSTSLKIDSVRNAIEYHQEVIRMFDSEDVKDHDFIREAGKAYYGLGVIYHVLRRYSMALDYYTSANEQFERISYTEGMAFGYNAAGESLEALGEYDQSQSFYDKSILVNELLGSDRLRILNATGKAHLLAHQNRTRVEEAKALIKPFLDEKASYMDQELLTLLYIQYGWVLNNLQEFETAEKYLSEGLELARQLNLTNYIYDGNIWLHDNWTARGDYKKALEYYKKAQSTRSRIINRRNVKFLYDAVRSAESETRELEMQMLARENEIVTLRLRRNQTTLMVGALLVILIAMILYIAYRQSKTNTEKKLLALEQSRLRSQMNPHFLFNSLNSIKHYIIHNEQKKAVLYLNKFSKLIRRILEASSIKVNSLKEELETVKLYMNIENIRFDNQIDFQVDIDPEINQHTVRIPSLSLQPFLENAIWHGLSSKEGEKKIWMEVKQAENGFIVITIRDNGIGREASEKLQKEKVLRRKSMGIPITRERLATFSRVYRNTFNLSFEDLYRDDGGVEGTQVILKIPTA